MKKEALKTAIKQLYENQEEYLKNNFNRSLPFQDGFFDRFERAERLGFAEKASIYNSALVFGDVQVGCNSWIGPYVIIDGSGGGVTIGDYCSISAGVHIYTHDSVEWALSGGNSQYTKAPVSIGNNTYIGAQTIIKAGVKIGSTCLIGANSFINKDIENNTIVVGNPGKVIGKVVIDDGKIKLDYY